MIDIGDGIELCVEAGGNPNNPPLLMIMGLGSQMIFWPDNFIKRLIDAGFFVIRFDNRDIGLSSKVQIDGLPRISQLKMMMRLQTGLSNKGTQVAYNLTDMAEDTARLIKGIAVGQNPSDWRFDGRHDCANRSGTLSKFSAAHGVDVYHDQPCIFKTTKT